MSLRVINGHHGGQLPQMGLVASLVKAPPIDRINKAAPEVRLPGLISPSGMPVKAVVSKAAIQFVIDDSGSKFGSFGTDPDDVRDAAARSVVSQLRRAGGGRVGVIRWGSSVGLVLPLTDVVSGRKAVTKALSAPQCLGGTCMEPALIRARSELPALAQDEVSATFILTDGLCDPHAGIVSAIAAFPRESVHLLLIDRHDACPATVEQSWRSTPLATVTRLTTVDTVVMATEIATVFANSVGLSLASPTRTPKKQFPYLRKD